MNYTKTYQKTLKGNLIQIGNTLGLSKASNSLTPGTLGSIGAFITTQNLTALGGWPLHTTTDYRQNSSSAILTLPEGAVVDYAELVWSASYVVPDEDVTANKDDAINFIDPRGTTNQVTANNINLSNLVLEENGETSKNYSKSAIVTNIVAQAGSGTYTVGKVPCAISGSCNNLAYAGWSLYVVYKSSADPVRNIVIFVGETTSIDPPYSVPADYPGPPFPLKICYTAAEGDATIINEDYIVSAGSNVTELPIGTSVQPSYSNPFSSIIGNQSGGIDTTGSFGTYNHDGVNKSNVWAGRQGWDIANNIDITSAFTGGAVSNLGLDVAYNYDAAILVASGFIVDANQPIATLTKTANKNTVSVGGEVIFTLVYRFTTVPMQASNIVVVDTIPNSATFVQGSVTLDNVADANLNPNIPGISLGSISSARTFTITYKVVANTIIEPTSIANAAFASYHFTSLSTQFINENKSNVPAVWINGARVTVSFDSDLKFATLGDLITYTFNLNNKGVALANMVIRDTVPNFTSLVANTFTINGASQSGNPSNMVLGTVPASSITTISYKVLVNSIPTVNAVKNSISLLGNFTLDTAAPNTSTVSYNSPFLTTTISSAIIAASKVVNTTNANVLDILTYTISVSNSGNVEAVNITLQDTIPTGTTLVSGSLLENGTALAGTPNPPGVSLKSIAAGARTTVVYKVKVDTIPPTNPIVSSSTIIFTYTIDSSTTPNRTSSGSVNTNTVSTMVENANLGGITKFADKAYAKGGDIVTYTIVIPNRGNVMAQNIVLRDTLPNGTSLISNSVTINGTVQVGANPNNGINIPNIAAGQTTTVTFRVIVNT